MVLIALCIEHLPSREASSVCNLIWPTQQTSALHIISAVFPSFRWINWGYKRLLCFSCVHTSSQRWREDLNPSPVASQLYYPTTHRVLPHTNELWAAGCRRNPLGKGVLHLAEAPLLKGCISGLQLKPLTNGQRNYHISNEKKVDPESFKQGEFKQCNCQLSSLTPHMLTQPPPSRILSCFGWLVLWHTVLIIWSEKKGLFSWKGILPFD